MSHCWETQALLPAQAAPENKNLQTENNTISLSQDGVLFSGQPHCFFSQLSYGFNCVTPSPSPLTTINAIKPHFQLDASKFHFYGIDI